MHTEQFLRNAPKEARLNGLVLLSVHRNINVDSEDVLTKFILNKFGAILII